MRLDELQIPCSWCREHLNLFFFCRKSNFFFFFFFFCPDRSFVPVPTEVACKYKNTLCIVSCAVLYRYTSNGFFSLSQLRKCLRMAGIRRVFIFKLELVCRMKQGASFSLHSCSAVHVYVQYLPSLQMGGKFGSSEMATS